MQACVNINGTITPADMAFISILDHGFLFGDSVYDAFRTYDRKLFLFNRHFDRLEHSARGVFLTLPWTREKFRSEMMRTIDADAPVEQIASAITEAVSSYRTAR